jgi:hypothetical protein
MAHVRTPTNTAKPAWRLACLAYREMREAGASDQEAHYGHNPICLCIGAAGTLPFQSGEFLYQLIQPNRHDLVNAFECVNAVMKINGAEDNNDP